MYVYPLATDGNLGCFLNIFTFKRPQITDSCILSRFYCCFWQETQGGVSLLSIICNQSPLRSFILICIQDTHYKHNRKCPIAFDLKDSIHPNIPPSFTAVQRCFVQMKISPPLYIVFEDANHLRKSNTIFFVQYQPLIF